MQYPYPRAFKYYFLLIIGDDKYIRTTELKLLVEKLEGRVASLQSSPRRWLTVFIAIAFIS